MEPSLYWMRPSWSLLTASGGNVGSAGFMSAIASLYAMHMLTTVPMPKRMAKRLRDAGQWCGWRVARAGLLAHVSARGVARAHLSGTNMS